MRIEITRRQTRYCYNENALARVGNALKGKPYNLKELAERSGFCYSYTSRLYNELLRLGRTKQKLKHKREDYGLVGGRDKRNSLLTPKKSLTEIAEEIGVEKEAIRQYAHRYGIFDRWARDRAIFLVERGENPGPLKRYLPEGYQPKSSA